MPAQDNKAIIRRGFEAMNSKDLSVFEQIMAPGYVNHDMPAPAPGPEGFKAVVGRLLLGIPRHAHHPGDAARRRGPGGEPGSLHRHPPG
jgi:hypothetical protein